MRKVANVRRPTTDVDLELEHADDDVDEEAWLRVRRRLGELIARQALDDLDARERVALEAHVPACAECRTTARELDETMALIALAAPARRPPASLRGSVLGAVSRRPAPTRPP